MIVLAVYIPESHLETVKLALFRAGAGRIGNYDSCAWQAKGTGQYRPLDGSNPFHGQHGTVESVDEWKVELVCEDAALPGVIRALREAHPYETPAFHAIKVMEIPPP